jgi:predicted transcriptional regulator
VFNTLIGKEKGLDEGRRDKHDIVMQILMMLKTAKSVRKTRLMTLLGLSSAQSKQYLVFLEKNRLIETNGHEISITQTGLDNLEKCSCCPMFERSNAIWKFKMKSF